MKGRETPVRVFEVLALKDELTLEMQARGREFAQTLDLYRRGDFSGAATGFGAFLERFPADGPARAFLERCRRYQETAPPEDWDTVFRPDSK